MEGDPGLQWPAQDDLASVWQGGSETSVPQFSCLRLCPVPCKDSTGTTKPWWYLGLAAHQLPGGIASFQGRAGILSPTRQRDHGERCLKLSYCNVLSTEA